jgi:hypothetical protein
MRKDRAGPKPSLRLRTSLSHTVTSYMVIICYLVVYDENVLEFRILII